MKRYSPLKPPDPGEWLALDESERHILVKEYHRRTRVRLPNAVVHAVIHVVVETQVAMGDELPVRKTLERLMGEGLDRHEALHAIGKVLAEHMFDLMNAKVAPPEPNEAYFEELSHLTAADWLAN